MHVETTTEHHQRGGTKPAAERADSASPTHSTTLLRTTALASLAAVLLVTIVYAVAGMTSGTPVIGTAANSQAVSLGNVIGASLFGCVAAFALAWACDRFAKHPRRVFTLAVGAGTALYSLVPVAVAASMSSLLWLNAMHVAVALPLAVGIRRQLDPGDR